MPLPFHCFRMTPVTANSMTHYMHSSDFYIICNGHRVSQDAEILEGQVYHVVPRLVGGKGGFGSMLRAIGAQIEKTTNREACRDLSGRRMRDVNYEKEMKDWIGKKAEREREKQAEREVRKARRRAPPPHKFDDPMYTRQTAVVGDNLSSALHAGLAASNTKKRKIAETVTSKSKKTREWLGMNDSDLDSNESDSIDEPSTSDVDSNGEHPSRTSACGKSENTHESTDNLIADNNGLSEVVDSQASVTSEINSEVDDKTTLNAADTTSEDNSLTTNGCGVDTACGRLYENERRNDGSQEITPDAIRSTQEPDEADRFDLERCVSASELEQLGLDRLKQELMDRGLKCGGTLAERAERLFRVKGLSEEEIEPGLVAKGKGLGKGKKSGKKG